MSIHLPNSPVRKIYECPKCATISVKFWNNKYNRSYTKDEWNTIRGQGIEVLRKIMQPITEDPKFFLE
jgi:hypothetical protein|tara:strand:- start:874 stop:1077 length:204 start_codon:yes stop_codon:yes gene_type:complete